MKWEGVPWRVRFFAGIAFEVLFWFAIAIVAGLYALFK